MFVAPEGVGLRRFDLRTGEEKWSSPASDVMTFIGASRTRGSSPGHVYGIDEAGNLIQLNRETGVRTGRTVLDRFKVYVHNELTDRLYLASTTGIILALREKDRELPTYYKFPDRLPLMPEFAPEGAPTEPEATGTEPTTPDDTKTEETTTEEKTTEETATEASN